VPGLETIKESELSRFVINLECQLESKMSFGRWYEQQQTGDASSSWVGGMLDLHTDQVLPLFEGMQPVNILESMGNMREAMEAQMPKKILGMGYQQRFKV